MCQSVFGRPRVTNMQKWLTFCHARKIAHIFRAIFLHETKKRITFALRYETCIDMVDVAQLVRASDCGSEGRGFEPLLPPQKGFFFKKPFFVPYSKGPDKEEQASEGEGSGGGREKSDRTRRRSQNREAGQVRIPGGGVSENRHKKRGADLVIHSPFPFIGTGFVHRLIPV